MRLGEGDKVSLQGSLKLEVYTSKNGEHKISRTLFADHVLALRQPQRQRTPKAAPAGANHQPARAAFDGGLPEEWRKRKLGELPIGRAGQVEEIDRVYNEHADLSDDDFVAANLQKWLT